MPKNCLFGRLFEKSNFFFLSVPSLLTCDATIDRMMSKWSTFSNSNNRLEEECRINVFRKNEVYLSPDGINHMIQLAEEIIDQLEM